MIIFEITRHQKRQNSIETNGHNQQAKKAADISWRFKAIIDILFMNLWSMDWSVWTIRMPKFSLIFGRAKLIILQRSHFALFSRKKNMVMQISCNEIWGWPLLIMFLVLIYISFCVYTMGKHKYNVSQCVLEENI